MKSIAFWTCLASAVVAFSTGAANYLAFVTADRAQETSTLARIGRQFDLSVGSSARLTMSIADVLGRLQSVQHGLATSDRQEVLSGLSPGFSEVRAKFGVDVMVATDALNRTVARAHDPEKFGDDQSKTRPMLVQANAQRLPMTGFEIGAFGLRIRGVVPVTYAGKHVGVLEIGQRLDAILENIRRVSSSDFAILLDRQVAARAMADPKSKTEVSRMIVEAATNEGLIKTLGEKIQIGLVKENATQATTIGDREYGVLLMPLADFSGQPLGVVVVARDMSDQRELRKTVLVETLAFSGMGAVIMSALILIVMNGLLIRPIEAAARSVEDMAEGRMPEPLPHAEGSSQVARLFASIERLRSNGEG